ncbi:MAG: PEP-CTERM sorting domain-containing protein [Phycisphaerales bacterium]|jgi:hypothetical protein|nr:PEP-CTERM sorting domain-containing protein [Phycisphaerales bacterium]
MMLKDGSEYGARVNFGTRNKDVVVFANGTSTTYSNAFSAAKWVKATMVLDEPTQTWDFIVEDADGNTLLNLQDLNFYSSTATKMTSATMLVVKYGGAYGDDIRVDDVSLEVVPEPGTLVLLAMGSVALYRRRRS